MKRLIILLVLCLIGNSAKAETFEFISQNTPASKMVKDCITNNFYHDFSLYALPEKFDDNKALACINNVQEAFPNDPQVYFVKSQLYYDFDNIKHQGNIEQAITSINHPSLMELSLPYISKRRIKLYIKQGHEENLDAIKLNIDNFIKNTDNTNFHNLFNGSENKFLWSLYDDKNISSYFVYTLYKYIMSKMNEEKSNEYTVPVVASYIQYIYNLDDNDSLFTKIGKTKEQILNSYIDAYEQGDGKYATIIRGIFIVASGDLTKGSDIINNEYAKNGDSYAYNIIVNSMSILKPKKVQKYGLGMGFSYSLKVGEYVGYFVKEIRNKDLTNKHGIKSGDYISEINGKNIFCNDFMRPPAREIAYKLAGEKDSKVQVGFIRYDSRGYRKKTFKTIIQRTYPVEGYEYFVFKTPYHKKNSHYEMMLLYPPE